MKPIFIFTLLVIAALLNFSCSSEHKETAGQKTVTVTGQIANPFADSIWIRHYQALNDLTVSKAAALDSLGRFKIEFQLEHPQIFTFYDGNEVSSLFLRPDDRLNMTLDTKAFDESIEYTGTGSIQNNYLKERYLRFYDKNLFSIYAMRDSLGAEKGIRYLDSLQQLRFRYLYDYITSHPYLDETFINLEKTNIEFEYPTRLFEFTFNKPFSDTSLNMVYELFDSYIHRPVLDKTAENYISYLSFYPGLLFKQNRERLKENTTRDSVMLHLIVSKTEGYAREYLLTNNVLSKIKDGNTKYYDNNKHLFDDYIKETDFKKTIQNEYARMVELMKQPMPEGAKLVNLEQERYKDVDFQQILDKYKGTVVYLDFWASWCGPCKAEMPASLMLQQYFSGKDVSFIYFSSDRDSLAWKKAIKMLRISGEHYRFNKSIKKETNALFNVRFIPRYILFDKNGKVVDDNAKRPSNPNLIPDIEALLD